MQVYTVNFRHAYLMTTAVLAFTVNCQWTLKHVFINYIIWYMVTNFQNNGSILNNRISRIQYIIKVPTIFYAPIHNIINIPRSSYQSQTFNSHISLGDNKLKYTTKCIIIPIIIDNIQFIIYPRHNINIYIYITREYYILSLQCPALKSPRNRSS